MSHLLDSVDAASLRSDVPAFRPGDTVNVHVRVIEGNRSRVQQFKGVVIRPPGSQSVIRDTNAKRDRPSGPCVCGVCSDPASQGRKERSRSVCCASVSIGARCYPAPL